VSGLWGAGGAAAVGGGQAPPAHDLCLVSHTVGQALELTRGRRRLSDELGPRLSFGGDGRGLGTGSPEPLGYPLDQLR